MKATFANKQKTESTNYTSTQLEGAFERNMQQHWDVIKWPYYRF